MVSKRKLQKLYHSKKFEGAFRSNKAFRRALKSHYGIKVSPQQVDEALGGEEAFFQSKPRKIKIKRRRFDLKGIMHTS